MNLQQHALPGIKLRCYCDFKHKDHWKEHTTNHAQGHSAILLSQDFSKSLLFPTVQILSACWAFTPELEEYTQYTLGLYIPQSFTSFPAALHMALCSFSFAVSSLYSSIASMIRSACAAQERHISDTRQAKAMLKSNWTNGGGSGGAASTGHHRTFCSERYPPLQTAPLPWAHQSCPEDVKHLPHCPHCPGCSLLQLQLLPWHWTLPPTSSSPLMHKPVSGHFNYLDSGSPLYLQEHQTVQICSHEITHPNTFRVYLWVYLGHCNTFPPPTDAHWTRQAFEERPDA